MQAWVKEPCNVQYYLRVILVPNDHGQMCVECYKVACLWTETNKQRKALRMAAQYAATGHPMIVSVIQFNKYNII